MKVPYFCFTAVTDGEQYLHAFYPLVTLHVQLCVLLLQLQIVAQLIIMLRLHGITIMSVQRCNF